MFLNVDLEIGSRGTLDRLVAELAPHLFELYRNTEATLHRAHYEVLPCSANTVDATLREFVRVLGTLTPRAKAIWNRARVRDFNIGLQAGFAPRSLELGIEAKTIEAIAKLRGRIVITVYAAGQLASRLVATT